MGNNKHDLHSEILHSNNSDDIDNYKDGNISDYLQRKKRLTRKMIQSD